MNNVLLTLDIDWAPDFTIDFVAEILISKGVCATWFVTHNSPAIERLRQHPELFELGIHPNFLPGSSHGDSTEKVLNYCLNLVPKAISMRTHALVQSTPIFAEVITRTPIKMDLSLFLPYTTLLQPVKYHWQEKLLLRLPYFWEDDIEMMQPSPDWKLTRLIELGEGLKIFDFHPIHIYLNSPDMKPYQELKKAFPKLDQATPEGSANYIYSGQGSQTIFLELVDYLSRKGSVKVQDLYQGWLGKK